MDRERSEDTKKHFQTKEESCGIQY